MYSYEVAAERINHHPRIKTHHPLPTTNHIAESEVWVACVSGGIIRTSENLTKTPRMRMREEWRDWEEALPLNSVLPLTIPPATQAKVWK